MEANRPKIRHRVRKYPKHIGEQAGKLYDSADAEDGEDGTQRAGFRK